MTVVSSSDTATASSSRRFKVRKCKTKKPLKPKSPSSYEQTCNLTSSALQLVVQYAPIDIVASKLRFLNQATRSASLQRLRHYLTQTKRDIECTVTAYADVSHWHSYTLPLVPSSDGKLPPAQATFRIQHPWVSCAPRALWDGVPGFVLRPQCELYQGFQSTFRAKIELINRRHMSARDLACVVTDWMAHEAEGEEGSPTLNLHGASLAEVVHPRDMFHSHEHRLGQFRFQFHAEGGDGEQIGYRIQELFLSETVLFGMLASPAVEMEEELLDGGAPERRRSTEDDGDDLRQEEEVDDDEDANGYSESDKERYDLPETETDAEIVTELMDNLWLQK